MALYVDGEQSTLEVILGAASLDDLLDRLDSAERISDEDVRIVRGGQGARAEIRLRERKLERGAGAEQRDGRRAARRAAASIEAQLAERQELLQLDQGPDRPARGRGARASARGSRRSCGDGRRNSSASRPPPRQPESIRPWRSSVSSPEGIGTAPPSSYGGGVVGDRDAVPRRAVRLGRRLAVRLRLLRPRRVRVRAGSAVPAAALHGRALELGSRSRTRSCRPATWSSSTALGHMGIYIGGGQFIHAPHTGDVVKISDMSPGSSYASSFIGARRL